MKTVVFAILLAVLVIVSVVQNQTIIAQHQTIMEMRSNPACMVAPASSPAESPRKRLI